MEKHQLQEGAQIRWRQGPHPNQTCLIVKVGSNHIEMKPLGASSNDVTRKETFRRPTNAVLANCELIEPANRHVAPMPGVEAMERRAAAQREEYEVNESVPRMGVPLHLQNASLAKLDEHGLTPDALEVFIRCRGQDALMTHLGWTVGLDSGKKRFHYYRTRHGYRVTRGAGAHAAQRIRKDGQRPLPDGYRLLGNWHAPHPLPGIEPLSPAVVVTDEQPSPPALAKREPFEVGKLRFTPVENVAPLAPVSEFAGAIAALRTKKVQLEDQLARVDLALEALTE